MNGLKKLINERMEEYDKFLLEKKKRKEQEEREEQKRREKERLERIILEKEKLEMKRKLTEHKKFQENAIERLSRKSQVQTNEEEEFQLELSEVDENKWSTFTSLGLKRKNGEKEDD